MVHQEEEIFDQISLNSIYMKISVSDEDFDQKKETELLVKAIEICYDKEFLKIDSTELIKDINNLNLSFVNYIKFCKKEFKYRKHGRLFIAYCDYFDLDYHKCYNGLHEKLRELIKKDLIKMLGGIANYTKIKNKLSPDSVLTLFDLFNM